MVSAYIASCNVMDLNLRLLWEKEMGVGAAGRGVNKGGEKLRVMKKESNGRGS